MKINHIALYTNDLEKLKSFYEMYFNAKANDMYFNPSTGLKTYFLSFESGARLEIMARPNVKQLERPILHSGCIHLAFSAGSKAKVDELTNTLKRDGYTVISETRTTGDGYYESCILDPDENQIEIVE